MVVEIISIGDELLIGHIQNTNASWIGEKLTQIGFQVMWITTIKDDVKQLHQCLNIAESRADVIIMTGGLGPTHDDMTKVAVSQYFNSKLVFNEKIYTHIKGRFKKRRIPMARVNKVQAMVPRDAEILFNEIGTAPGLLLVKNGKKFYVLPGVPREMHYLMEKYVLAQLLNSLKTKHYLATRMLMTTGISESMLYNKLGKIDKIEKYAKVAFLPNLKGVRIRLTASESGKQKPLDLLDKAEKLIRDKVDDYIYADQDIPLEHVVGKLLENQSATLAVAESCTGGLVGHRLTNIAGSSAYFGYGIVSYSNDAKVKTINVPPGLFEKHGAVSPQVASAMASGVRNLAKSTFGLSTTGIAGPTGGTKDKPVGLVYIGFASDERIVVEKYNFADDRIGNKIRISQAALELVRRQILLINR